ncbi:MAG: hypothetical protein QOE26_323 [Verrucomicrobiota bacterium]|jgi:hypothetical protein
MLGESEIGWAKGNSIAWFLLRNRGDILGGNLVKVRKYEGEMRETAWSVAFPEAKEKSSSESWCALAGVIVILALCDRGILFTCY